MRSYFISTASVEETVLSHYVWKRKWFTILLKQILKRKMSMGLAEIVKGYVKTNYLG